MSESGVYRREILTSKYGSRSERVKAHKINVLVVKYNKIRVRVRNSISYALLFLNNLYRFSLRN